MEIDRSALKQMARNDMRRKKPPVMAVSLVYLVLTMGLAVVVMLAMLMPLIRTVFNGLLLDLTEEELGRVILEQMGTLAIGFVLLPLIALFAVVLQQGYAGYSLSLAQGRPAGWRDLLGGFGMLGRTLGMYLLVGLFSFLWTMAICVPAGLLMALAEWLFGEFEAIIFLVTLPVQVGAQALLYNRVLRYALAPYALADQPELGALGAIRRSRELMRGRRWELFKLYLSFLGWLLLGFLAVMAAMYVGAAILVAMLQISVYSGAVADVTGIWAALLDSIWVVYGVGAFGSFLYYMWLMPYVGVTLAHFYCAVSAPAVPPEERQAPGQGDGPSTPPAPPEDPWDRDSAPDSRNKPF